MPLEKKRVVPIERLSNELLKHIIDEIEPDPEKIVPVDRRQFLSVESFELPLPSATGSILDVWRIKWTCRWFSRVAEPVLYSRIVARFTEKDLKRLKTIATWPHVARHVKKFSFLVPYFYVNGTASIVQKKTKTTTDVSQKRSRNACWDQ